MKKFILTFSLIAVLFAVASAKRKKQVPVVDDHRTSKMCVIDKNASEFEYIAQALQLLYRFNLPPDSSELMQGFTLCIDTHYKNKETVIKAYQFIGSGEMEYFARGYKTLLYKRDSVYYFFSGNNYDIFASPAEGGVGVINKDRELRNKMLRDRNLIYFDEYISCQAQRKKPFTFVLDPVLAPDSTVAGWKLR